MSTKQPDSMLKYEIKKLKALFLKKLNADAPDEQLIAIAIKIYFLKWVLNISRTGQPDDAIQKEDVEKVEAVLVRVYEEEIARLYKHVDEK